MLILTSCDDDSAAGVVVVEDVLPHAASMKHNMERIKQTRNDRFILLFSSFLDGKWTAPS